MKGEELLKGVHPALGQVLRIAAMRGVEFQIVQGRRTLDQQRALVKSGASGTLHSRHLASGQDRLAKAVDLVALTPDGSPDWAEGREGQVYGALNAALQLAATQASVVLKWGGSWVKPDWDHWELPERVYP